MSRQDSPKDARKKKTAPSEEAVKGQRSSGKDRATPAHYETKPGHFETLKIHFPTSEGVSERANE